MAKSFLNGLNSGINSLIPEQADQEQPGKAKPGRKKTNHKIVVSTSQEGTKEGETRATFIVNETYLDKMKDIAYWDRLPIKDVVNGALGEYLAKYEKKNGTVNKRPV